MFGNLFTYLIFRCFTQRSEQRLHLLNLATMSFKHPRPWEIEKKEVSTSKVLQERTAEANTKRMSTRSYCQLLQWKVFFHTNRAVSVLCGIASTEIIHHNRSRALILDLRSFIMLCYVASQKHTQRFHWLLLRLARGQSCHCATKEIHGTGSFMKFPQILGLANGISQIWWHATG